MAAGGQHVMQQQQPPPPSPRHLDDEEFRVTKKKAEEIRRLVLSVPNVLSDFLQNVKSGLLYALSSAFLEGTFDYFGREKVAETTTIIALVTIAWISMAMVFVLPYLHADRRAKLSGWFEVISQTLKSVSVLFFLAFTQSLTSLVGRMIQHTPPDPFQLIVAMLVVIFVYEFSSYKLRKYQETADVYVHR